MKYVLTDIGAELLAKIGTSGKGLHFTKAQAGAGYSDEPEQMTELINGQLDMQMADMERQQAVTTLTLLVTNHALQEEHKIQQIGIFALDEATGEEVLFMVGQDLNGDILPDINYGRTEYRYMVNIKISNALNIELAINDTDFVLKKTFEKHVGAVNVVEKGDLQTQINAIDAKVTQYLGNNTNENDKPVFAEGIEADNVIDAINQVFQVGNEKKAKLVENLVAVGVQASTSDTWEQLLDKVPMVFGSIYDAFVAVGVTPTAQTPEALVAAISTLQQQSYNSGKADGAASPADRAISVRGEIVNDGRGTYQGLRINFPNKGTYCQVHNQEYATWYLSQMI